MNEMKLAIGGAVFILCVGSALADTSSELLTIQSDLMSCMNKSDGSDLSNRSCTAIAQKKVDDILNNMYKNRLNQLSLPSKDNQADYAEIKKRLVASERAWITFRDTQCSLESAKELGGTIEVDEYIGCIYGNTKERIETLDGLF